MRSPILDSLREVLREQSAQIEKAGLCPDCGSSLSSVNIMCWLYDQNDAWNLRLPVCPICESKNRTSHDLSTDKSLFENCLQTKSLPPRNSLS